MNLPAQASAQLEGGMVVLARRSWCERFPVECLASRLAFYRGLACRRGGAYAAFYQPTLEALERLQREVQTSAPCSDRAVTPPAR